eukprot:scaffold80554_cov61-Phaeocystis_antarctica.AAC.4
MTDRGLLVAVHLVLVLAQTRQLRRARRPGGGSGSSGLAASAVGGGFSQVGTALALGISRAPPTWLAKKVERRAFLALRGDGALFLALRGDGGGGG